MPRQKIAGRKQVNKSLSSHSEWDLLNLGKASMPFEIRKAKPAKGGIKNKDEPTKKPHRYRPGTVAIREIKRY